MNIISRWVDNRCFIASNAQGNSIVMEGSAVENGVSRGASPMELLLMGIAGCSSIDVVDILKKQRQDIVDCITNVEGKRADSIPRVFTDIHLHFKVVGRGIKIDAVEKAVKLSAEKYCSASIMLSKAANITHSFEVVEAA